MAYHHPLRPDGPRSAEKGAGERQEGKPGWRSAHYRRAYITCKDIVLCLNTEKQTTKHHQDTAPGQDGGSGSHLDPNGPVHPTQLDYVCTKRS